MDLIGERTMKQEIDCQCSHKVHKGAMGIWRLCYNKATVVRHGRAYCTLHDPERERQKWLEEKRRKEQCD